MSCRGVQDPGLRTRIRQDSAHFEQTGSEPDYGFVQVSGSGFSNFIFWGFGANTIIKKNFCKDLKDVMCSQQLQMCEKGAVTPVSSEIYDLLLFFSYFASQNEKIKSGNYFFDVCYVN